MKRRIFLKLLAGGLLLTFASTAKARVRAQKHNHLVHHANDLVMDQSGVFGNGAFVMGVLSCKNAEMIAKKVAAIRRSTHFRCTLSHASRNKWKKQYAHKLINFWVNSPNMKIDLLVLRDGSRLENRQSIERLSLYTEMASRLLDTSPYSNSRRRLVTQAHFKSERQATFESMLTMRSARIDEILHINDGESDLLQFIDLIVGAVQASQKTTQIPVSNSTKLEIVKYLMNKLGIDSFEGELRHPRCSITFV